MNMQPHADPSKTPQEIWEDFSLSFTPAVKEVVEFAKHIPGFSFLSQNDQVTLLKAGTFEVRRRSITQEVLVPLQSNTDHRSEVSTDPTRQHLTNLTVLACTSSIQRHGCKYNGLQLDGANISSFLFQVLMVRFSSLFNVKEQTVSFISGATYSLAELRAMGMSELLGAMFDFSHKLATLELSAQELGLFTAVVLVSAGAHLFSDQCVSQPVSH